jgi:branched-chain amino acid transport system substrate-binding protein
VAAVAAVLTTGLAACGSSAASHSGGASADSGGSGLPNTIKVMAIRPMTGPVAFAGINAHKGAALAVQQINQRHVLGDTKLKVDLKDAGASRQKATSFATQAVSDKAYSALFGPALSARAKAVSRIAQKAKMPVIYTQAGSDGVLIGDYTYRITAPASSFYDLAGKYVQSKHVRTATVLYNSGNPTLAEPGKQTVPKLAGKYGFKVIGSTGVQTKAQDFTASAQKIASANPDAAFLELTGPQYPRAITQLKQDGYQGEIVGMSAMGAGNLDPAGEKAAGAVWPTDFNPRADLPGTQAFVNAYKAKYGGKLPNNYAAEAYDAVWFLARGIKKVGSADRTEIQQGLEKVTHTGFKGAEGKLRFKGNDLRVHGVLVHWTGTKSVPVPGFGS